MNSSNQPSQGLRSPFWWVLASLGVIIAIRRSHDLSTWQTQTMMASMLLMRMAKILMVARTSSASLGGTVGLILLQAGAVALAVLGVPDSWLRWPDPVKVLMALLPVVMFATAVLAGLVALAKWNKNRGESDMPAQSNKLAVALNLVIAVASWQVVRETTTRDMFEGLFKLPQMVQNTRLLEQTVGEWTESIRTGKPPASDLTGTPLAAAPPTEAKKDLPLAMPVGSSMDETEAVWQRALAGVSATSVSRTVEHWVEEADKSGHDPGVELLAAQALVADGQADRAHDRVALCRGLGYDSPDLAIYHARLMASRGEMEAALELAEQVLISNNGTDDDAVFFFKCLDARQEYRRGLATIDRLMVFRPSRMLQRWQAAWLVAEGDIDGALGTMHRLAQRRPVDPTDAYRLGELALAANRPHFAVAAVNVLRQSGDRSERALGLAANVESRMLSGRSRSGKK